MDKRLINTLLDVLHSPITRIRPSKGLRGFSEAYNLGMMQGASLVFSESDKAEIGRILHGEMGIDPTTTTSASWNQLDRASSLNLAHDEKLSGHSVGAGRLRLKTLKGQPLQVAGGNWPLPPRADLGLDLEAVLGRAIGHDALLIVENLQTFDDIQDVATDVMAPLANLNPLVLYRGDAQGGARTDAVHALIAQTTLPVHAFVDFDPAGLVIAANLPRLDRVLAPRLDALAATVRAHGLVSRYLDQVAKANLALHRLEADPRIAPLWEVIRGAGKGLPQEYFHSGMARKPHQGTLDTLRCAVTQQGGRSSDNAKTQK